eukprot:3500523-Rhodomonas_salina.2
MLSTGLRRAVRGTKVRGQIVAAARLVRAQEPRYCGQGCAHGAGHFENPGCATPVLHAVALQEHVLTHCAPPPVPGWQIPKQEYESRVSYATVHVH